MSIEFLVSRLGFHHCDLSFLLYQIRTKQLGALVDFKAQIICLSEKSVMNFTGQELDRKLKIKKSKDGQLLHIFTLCFVFKSLTLY